MGMNIQKLSAVMIALGLGFASWTLSASGAGPATTQAAAVNQQCPVSGDPVDPKAPTVEYKGKTIGFCCESCIPEFKADPEKFIKKMK